MILAFVIYNITYHLYYQCRSGDTEWRGISEATLFTEESKARNHIIDRANSLEENYYRIDKIWIKSKGDIHYYD
jgi:uncharacterized membrane protein YfhO